MKRKGHIYEGMISDDNIRKAILSVNLSHRWMRNHTPNRTVMWVEYTMNERIKELRNIIETGFVPTKPVLRKRYDRNAKKWRDICEPKLYPDQYIHHILIQSIEPILMRGMDKYCCGSIKERGATYGINAIKKWMRKDRKGTRLCLEMDIRHFYEELQPSQVMSMMKQLIKDRRVLELIERVMLHGVTIGAYFSQWFANSVLQPLDAIIRECRVSHYIRYMDNFTVFSSNKRTLRKVVQIVAKWLEEHGLQLKGNWQYFKTRTRFPNALGYRFGHTFTLIRKMRLLTIRRQIKSFYRQKEDVSPRFAMSLLSRIGGLVHCNNQSIRKEYIPNGLQKKLKDVVRIFQRVFLIKWETCMEDYVRLYT